KPSPRRSRRPASLAASTGIFPCKSQLRVLRPGVARSWLPGLKRTLIVRQYGRMTSERIEVQRTIEAGPAAIFRVLCDPDGHVAIDSTGMLMSATGEPVTAAGQSFVVHMDREALNDYPLGRYDVTVTITTFHPDREIAWKILGRIRPQIGHIYGYRLEPGPA